MNLGLVGTETLHIFDVLVLKIGKPFAKMKEELTERITDLEVVIFGPFVIDL